MKITKKTLMWPIRKRKAVSPVIAVILLIGLTVLAAALMFFIVLPMLNPPPDYEISQSYIEYNDELTITEGTAWGQAGVTIRNTGQVAVEIGQVNMYYYISNASGNFPIKIENVFVLGEGFNDANPLEIPATQNKQVNINFLLPEDNKDNTVQYSIEVVPSISAINELSTDFGNLYLSKDNPTIILEVDSTVRRGVSLEPIVNDNSEIKNVTYRIHNTTDLLATKSVTSTVEIFNWNWATRVGEEYGFTNGDYIFEVIVYDYAGNFASVNNSITIDNDYVNPTIVSYNVTSPYTDGTVEVGNSVTVEAQITDTGSEVSEVKYAFIYYRNGNETWIEDWQKVASPMIVPNALEPNNYVGTISSSALNFESMDIGYLQIAIEAIDADSNTNDDYKSSNFNNYTVVDNFEPDISHTPAVLGEQYLSLLINATIDDADLVNEATALLHYRFSNDVLANVTAKYYEYLLPTGYTTLSPSLVSNNDYQWEIPAINVTIHGIEYYITVEDRTGNLANDGTSGSPFQILIPDDIPPFLTHFGESSWTEGVDLGITCIVDDNDPGFGAEGTYLNPTGKVTLYYQFYEGTEIFTTQPMNYLLGNTSDGGTSTWTAIIPGGTFLAEGSYTVKYYIVAEDYSGQTSGSETRYSIVVSPEGTPIIEYVENTIRIVDGSGNGKIRFDIKNNAVDVTADGNIIAMKIATMGTFGADIPVVNETSFTGIGITWSEDSGVANNTWFDFTLFNVTMASEQTRTVDVTFQTNTDTDNPYDILGVQILIAFKVVYGAMTEGEEQQLPILLLTSSGPPYSFTDTLTTGASIYYDVYLSVGSTVDIAVSWGSGNRNFDWYLYSADDLSTSVASATSSSTNPRVETGTWIVDSTGWYKLRVQLVSGNDAAFTCTVDYI